MKLTRRSLLMTGGAALAGAALGLPPVRAGIAAVPDTVEVELVARRRSAQILPALAGPSPVITYTDDFPGPILRLKKGQALRATLFNQLDAHTSIHWHGIRLPNREDGVPFLTQNPVLPGERFTYQFTPPDAGSFFFHPHCDTSRHPDRGGRRRPRLRRRSRLHGQGLATAQGRSVRRPHLRPWRWPRRHLRQCFND
jgi:FtsP/CotA-like multicopper oxidase with cupredoxin domain